MRRILYILAFIVQAPPYLPGILWQLMQLAAMIVAGALRVARNRVLAFLIGSLARWIGDVVSILRWINSFLGLQ